MWPGPGHGTPDVNSGTVPGIPGRLATLLGRSLLAVAAAAQNLLKNSAEALPLFCVKKQRRCRLSLVTKKSSGAAATATEKVAALVAALVNSAAVPITDYK